MDGFRRGRAVRGRVLSDHLGDLVLANSHRINNLSGGLFGGQNWAWGLWDLLIAALAIMAGSSLLKGGVFGRLMGYVWGVVVIVQSLVIVGYAPWFAALSIALAAAVIYAVGVAPLEE